MLIKMRPSLGLITMLRGFEREGGRADALLERFGLSLEQLDPARMVVRTLESAVHDEMARQIMEEGLPQKGMRIGQHFSMAGYGLFVMLLMNCATVRQLLEVGVAYQNMTFLFSTMRLKPGPCEIGLLLELEGVSEDTWRFRIDEEMSGTYKLISDLRSALALPPQTFRVSLPFAAPEDPVVLQEYRDYYGQNVEFDSAAAGIWIENEVLEWQIPSADAAALEVHRLQCDQILSQYEQQVGTGGEWTIQVRVLMELLQGGIPDAATVAQALGVSERTLRYRLSLEDQNYRQLRDQVLYQKACRLLRERPWGVDRIAAFLGYADAAAFIHAFRRWSGQTPCQSREQLRLGARVAG